MTADIRTAAQREAEERKQTKDLENRGLRRSISENGATYVPLRGKPRAPEQVLERFHSSYVIDSHGCWIWQRSLSSGYGQMRVGAKNWGMHRWSYTNFIGEIPEGMFVCHKCDVPACVNPSHLEIVSSSKNTKDAFDRGLITHWSSRKTHCKSGHEFTSDNTEVRRGQRVCIACEFRRVECPVCGVDISRKALRLHEQRKHSSVMQELAEGAE